MLIHRRFFHIGINIFAKQEAVDKCLNLRSLSIGQLAMSMLILK